MGTRDSGIHLEHRRRQGLRWICAAVASACATTIVPATQAATSFWTNSAGGTYHVASNWNGGAGPAPGPSDTAEFDLAATYSIAFASNSGAGTFNQTSGDVTVLTDGSAKSLTFGPFNVLGGNLTMGSSGARLDIRGTSVQVGSGGAATVGFGNRLHMSSGGLSIGTTGSGSASLTVDGTNSQLNSDTQSGIFLLGGAADSSPASGSLTVSNNAVATPRGITMTRGTIAVQSGADVTCSGNIVFGTQTSVVTPAMMTVTGAGSTFLQDVGSFFDVGYAGTSTSVSNPASLMISSSGTVTTNSGGILRIGQSGTVDFTGGNLVIKGGVLVSGGTLAGTTPATPLISGFSHTFTVDSAGSVNLTGGAVVDLVAVGSVGGNQYVVKDAGSAFTADGTLRVRDGTSFKVQAGATLNVAAMEVSNTSGFSSTAIIDGAGAMLLSGPVTVGVSASSDLDASVLRNNATGTINGALNVYSRSTNALAVESGAAVTVDGPMAINLGTYNDSPVCYVTGTGSALTQTGANGMTIGFPNSGLRSTVFKSSFGGVISTGTGLLTINGADVGAGSGGTFNVNGDVLINKGQLTLTSWASGKTMNLLTFATCQAGDLTLVGNTINLQGPIASFSGGTVTLNGGSSLNVQDTGSAAFTHLHLGTDGTAGSLIVGSVSSQHVTSSGQCDWGAAGGSATVTLSPNTAVDVAANSPLNLASSGTGTVAQVLVDRAVMTLGWLNMQDATTGAASATLTIQGSGGRLEQRLPASSSSIGGSAGSGTATINVHDGGVLLASGTLVLKSTGTLDLSAGTAQLDSLALSGGKLKLHSGALTITQTPTATNGGQLDLEDNAFVVRTSSVGTWDGSAYTDITGLIVSGRNGGSWDGTGVITSQTDAIGSNYTTIAVALASDVRPITGTETTTWAGYTVSSSNVLVMYTYGGDATLDGKINIDDYVRIDNGIAGGLTGWSNGDFNYDGKVNIDDYTTVIDQNIGDRGSPSRRQGVSRA